MSEKSENNEKLPLEEEAKTSDEISIEEAKSDSAEVIGDDIVETSDSPIDIAISDEDLDEKDSNDKNDLDEEELIDSEPDADDVNNDIIDELADLSIEDIDREKLVALLKKLITSYSVSKINSPVTEIINTFKKKTEIHIAELKKKFLDEGGESLHFNPVSTNYENEFKSLVKNFDNKKADFYRKLDEEKQINYNAKLEVINKIKDLSKGEESLNNTFNEFRELQKRWKEIGIVSQQYVKELWSSYHYAVEQFYDFVNINKELRDLDLKKNLKAKEELCEKVEELFKEKSVKNAYKKLQDYHRRWREIGPVDNSIKEDVWDRFKGATKVINKLYQDHFQEAKKQQDANYEQKLEICKELEIIAEIDAKASFKEWDAANKKINDFQAKWKSIGYAPKRYNEEVYKQFRDILTTFYDKRKEYYKHLKQEKKQNLIEKIAICEKAEELKETTNWKDGTKQFLDLQSKWKTIGPVPQKYSDKVWKRFRSSCDFFFNNKNKYFSTKDEREIENQKLKKDILKRLSSYKSTDNKQILDDIKTFQKEWVEIGHVPISEKKGLEEEYSGLINSLYGKLDISEEERSLLRYKQKIEGLASGVGSSDKLYNERNAVRLKMNKLNEELGVLENNVGFFNIKGDGSSLLDGVNKNMDNLKKSITFLKKKLQVIDNFSK